ncbi:hypothetical protein [Rubrivirga sp. IMCC45206]|uniref:hypothetical protein n=1 Tax=Rubrivirga sp. IMCC45206 TaxID=3391614 RepID=UPI003990359F
MHPDQTTPESHRYSASDSKASGRAAADHVPETDQDSDAIAPYGDAAPAAAEVEDGARVAEAGNAYVGRTMDDRLKSSPRVEDGDEAVDEDPSTPGDD